MTEETIDRVPLLRRALRLEYLTVGWNVLEGLVAVTAALAAGSIALLGFGVDSFVECASGLVLVWRLGAEHRSMDEEAIEQLDRRAHRLVGASLFLLAAYIAIDAGLALWHGERPRASPVGIGLTALSIVTMAWLARAKRRAARTLGSSALEADAFQTTACPGIGGSLVVTGASKPIPHSLPLRECGIGLLTVGDIPKETLAELRVRVEFGIGEGTSGAAGKAEGTTDPVGALRGSGRVSLIWAEEAVLT